MQIYHNLPNQRFRCLTIDPPWPISMTGRMKKARNQRADKLPYQTLSVEQIKAFPVADLAERGGHVYLWATNRFMPDAYDVLKAWGCRYHLTMALVKKSGIAPCRGYIFGAEYCLLGFYGKPHLPFLRMGKLNWLVTNPLRGTHSRKPDAFYDLVREMSPGPRLDCFSRRAIDGWTVWGNEAPEILTCSERQPA